jgi:uracil-DNA glycosylase family 4
MSQLSARSVAFLGEMGVGPQWTLRNAPPAALFDDALPSPNLNPRPDPDSQAAPEPVAAAVPVAPVAVVSAPAATAAPVPVVAAPAAAPVPEPRREEPPTMDDSLSALNGLPASGDDTAWFDDAPAPARAAPVSEKVIAAMDWPALNAAISSCTRCELCATRRNAVPGRGAAAAEWMAIAPAPSRQDEKDQRPISGEAGQLLDNMLKAIALSTESQVYVTQLVKCRPQTEDGADRSPTLDEVTACRPFLERELALTGAQMVMTFGQLAAKGLLGAASRGKVHRYRELPVVATYHPDDLLRKPEDKAKAWADLCLARTARD